MRTLKHKQYTHRYKQFMKTFESVFPMESDDYDMDAQIQFNKVLAAENIAPVDWWTAFCNRENTNGRMI